VVSTLNPHNSHIRIVPPPPPPPPGRAQHLGGKEKIAAGGAGTVYKKSPRFLAEDFLVTVGVALV